MAIYNSNAQYLTVTGENIEISDGIVNSKATVTTQENSIIHHRNTLVAKDSNNNILAPHIIPFRIGNDGKIDMQVSGNALSFYWNVNGTVYSQSRLQLTGLAEDTIVWLVINNVNIPPNFSIDNNNVTQKIKLDLLDLQNKILRIANFTNCNQLTGDISGLRNLTYYASFANCNQLTGDISNLRNLTNSADFANCNQITGDISNLRNLTNTASFTNCNQITGDISNLRNLTNYAEFYNCNQLTGDISNLRNLTTSANFTNCNQITGDISGLRNLTYYANFTNCTQLTGDISNLRNLTNTASFYNCNQLTGAYNPTVLTPIRPPVWGGYNFYKTAQTPADVDTTLNTILKAAKLDGSVIANGTPIKVNKRTSASDSDVMELTSKGFKVYVDNIIDTGGAL